MFKALDFLAGWIMTMIFPIAPIGVSILLIVVMLPEHLGVWDRDRGTELFDAMVWPFIAAMSAIGAWWTVRSGREES